MKVKICGESFCHYDSAEVEEVLTCDECPYQIEVDVEQLISE
jgi:hypothetical protein